MESESFEELIRGISRTGLSAVELWLSALGIGASLTQLQVARILEGSRYASPYEHDVLASALNDWFVEAGLDHPVRYWGELQAA